MSSPGSRKRESTTACGMGPGLVSAPFQPACATAATIVVAGVGVRTLAESARQGGWRVVALDLFGDRDTRAASARWMPIGEASALRIDARRLHAALREAARIPGAIGWIAGSGFEGAPALREIGGPALTCLGTATAQVRRLRDPARFFEALDRLGLAHPQVSHTRPARPGGWLAKRAGACGGAHVRDAAEIGDDLVAPHADGYYQRFQAGVPMSALFVADGRRAVVVALNRQLVQPFGNRRHVYAGVVGPLVDDPLMARVELALADLVGEFDLRGLASLDFIAAGATPWLLEINPRPSASMALHADAWPGGLVQAHVQAVRGHLPEAPARRPDGVRGERIVFAERACGVDAPLSDALAESSHCHDLPLAGTRFGEGDPVCSVSAEAANVDAVERLLDGRARAVQTQLAGRTRAALEEIVP